MNCYYYIFYVAGFCLVFAYDDISYNKGATQSQTFVGTGYGASNAVDGNLATCTRTKDIGGRADYATAWWKVDLGGVYRIYSVNILFKSYDGFVERQRGRFAGFSLYVSNSDVSSDADIKGSTLCYKDGTELPPLNFTRVCTEKGRYIIYYNERLEGVVYPTGYEVDNMFTELCEFIVQGCKNASFYGSNCDRHCPTNCANRTCRIESGSCFNCKPGWTGTYCNTTCREGRYGINCSNQCLGHCKDGATCNHVAGYCDRGCDAGWKETVCDKACIEGYFGTNCSRVCSPNCTPGTCRHTDGSCSCSPGWTGHNCTTECSEGHFGSYCFQNCSPNCEPGTCRQTDGVCYCVTGWMGDNCTKACVQSYGEYCRNPCSVQCYNDTCDKTNGRCLIGCKDGFYGEFCDKENSLTSQPMSTVIMLGLGLSVSVFINLIFITCGILLFRASSLNRDTFTGACSLLKCWKKSVYQDIVVKSDETSTYQELDISESAYRNTTIR